MEPLGPLPQPHSDPFRSLKRLDCDENEGAPPTSFFGVHDWLLHLSERRVGVPRGPMGGRQTREGTNDGALRTPVRSPQTA
jgi:hypothetical protein